MVSRTYTYLLAIAAVLVSVTGAFFSVTGLVALFSGAGTSVAVMAGSLEFSKFIVVGFVYRFWGHIHRPLRVYLLFSIVVLMAITSLGIYGYLSNAYGVASVEVHSRLLAIDSLEKENARVQGQINDLKGFIDQIPKSRMSKKFEFQREYEPKLVELEQRSDALQKEIEGKRVDFLHLQTQVGPVVYLAKAVGADVDDVVKWLILVFVSVFDPLAVSLVFSLNLLIRLREKYRNNEYKIGAQSLTTPVDHRFRNSA
jgi:hypothetical protein